MISCAHVRYVRIKKKTGMNAVKEFMSRYLVYSLMNKTVQLITVITEKAHLGRKLSQRICNLHATRGN